MEYDFLKQSLLADYIEEVHKKRFQRKHPVFFKHWKKFIGLVAVMSFMFALKVNL